jgi:hypothetical protein
VSNGVDHKNGIIYLHDLLPDAGDTVTVTNNGTHYELRCYHWSAPVLLLTDEDIARLSEGLITFH